MCEECALIAHDRCTVNAPPTCGLRAQLLQYASYSPSPDSPNPLDVLQRLTPATSPGAVDSSTVFSSNASVPAGDVTVEGSSNSPAMPPPTSFKMFGAFRRSRSSLSVDPSVASRDGSAESVQTRAGKNSPVIPSVTSTSARRPKVLKKGEHARPRPLSVSSDGGGTTPNRSSLRSAATGESVDVSDESRSQSHAHSQSRSRGRGGTVAVSFVSDAETTDAGGTRYAPSRMSMAVSAADSQQDSEWQGQERRRGSLYGAESTVGEASEYGDAEDGGGDDDEPIAARERTATRKGKRVTHSGEKEKGCIVQ